MAAWRGSCGFSPWLESVVGRGEREGGGKKRESKQRLKFEVRGQPVGTALKKRAREVDRVEEDIQQQA